MEFEAGVKSSLKRTSTHLPYPLHRKKTFAAAAAAVTALTRHIPYVTRLKGEKAPGAPRLDPEAALDTIDENGFEGAGKFIFFSTRVRAIRVTSCSIYRLQAPSPKSLDSS